ncbi:MAG TPA: hypothetical protein VFT74_19000 [Isosphaeraceae bacterium]|nr:hypothetical protein [Isosphaeraceae bacterium]
MRIDRGIQAVQVRRSAKGVLSPVNLREVYQLPGEFTVKMMIDPALSQVIEGVEVDVRNSDGRKMQHSAKRWGTKLNVTFVIDDSTPDGVSVIDVTMRRRGQLSRERFGFWVVK